VPPPFLLDDDVLFECGDGEIDKLEECDDNNLVDGDGCNRFCIKEACGNRILDRNEECEDGNLINGDGCSATCENEDADLLPSALCGNSVIDPGEQCDDGDLIDNNAGTNLCRSPVCGDGIINTVNNVLELSIFLYFLNDYYSLIRLRHF